MAKGGSKSSGRGGGGQGGACRQEGQTWRWVEETLSDGNDLNDFKNVILAGRAFKEETRSSCRSGLC